MQKRQKVTVWFIFLTIFLVGCAPQFSEVPFVVSDTQKAVTAEIQKERDDIYILAAYAVVYNDWQDGTGKKREHNIGSVLVDPDGKIVNWARNCNASLSNGTQHGEVRLMMGYLNRVGGYSLKDHTVYQIFLLWE